MKKSFIAITAVALVGTSTLTIAQAPDTTQPTMQTTTQTTTQVTECSQKKATLNMALRKLWTDHIVYTRNYIISALANLGDKDAVAQRLLKNQDDIGAAIVPYYGVDAGNKLAALLREHILISADVIKAAKAGNKNTLKQVQLKWFANADTIAAFLNTANPNWDKNDLLTMLHDHLDLTTKELTARLAKNWNGDIAAFDQVNEHMLKFADLLTDGIAKQFPEKF